jgi:hypothetical protein
VLGFARAGVMVREVADVGSGGKLRSGRRWFREAGYRGVDAEVEVEVEAEAEAEACAG